MIEYKSIGFSHLELPYFPIVRFPLGKRLCRDFQFNLAFLIFIGFRSTNFCFCNITLHILPSHTKNIVYCSIKSKTKFKFYFLNINIAQRVINQNVNFNVFTKKVNIFIEVCFDRTWFFVKAYITLYLLLLRVH